ncbi:MAG TPA: transglutaminase N-terminal domain-containing protein, partial [Jatrophihabitantaceae bacterium]|nr:transglutaminase N-terminal domain-containing protein [Jatrophihabitantaceae bacterium]
MTSRLRVHHVSRYSYDQPVVASFNEARLTPLATPWQTLLESTLRVDEASWQHQYVDYWGTHVRVFEAQRPHSGLV